VDVIYCPTCKLPSEYCEFSATFTDKCLPWILENCPEVLGAEIKAKLDKESGGGAAVEGDEPKKKEKKNTIGLVKKKEAGVVQIVISRVQRQKKKYVTSVVGLDTVEDLKIKDCAKLFGKKFASGASVGETATGGKEVVIQGDVSFEIPGLLIKEYNLDPKSIFFCDDGKTIRPYA